MRTIHANWAFIAVGLNAFVGFWGLLWVRRRPRAPKPFWPLVYAGQGAIAFQVVLGVILHQRSPAPSIHMFYGFVLLIAAAVSYALRSENPQHNATIFSAVALFIGIVGAARGIPTATP